MPPRRFAAALAACWLAAGGPLAATAAHAQPVPATPAAVARFDADVAKAVKAWKAPGLAIAVVRNDSVLLGHTFTRIAPAR